MNNLDINAARTKYRGQSRTAAIRENVRWAARVSPDLYARYPLPEEENRLLLVGLGCLLGVEFAGTWSETRSHILTALNALDIT